MYSNTLASNTKQVLTQLSTLPIPANFYLSGGTALALHLGHRESEDLDFFSNKDFIPTRLQQTLESLGDLTSTELEDNTLNTYLSGVKLQFLGYPYPLLKPLIIWENIQLSSVLDIALTKLQTIGMRGSKKDFIDLYFILQQISLSNLLKQLPTKYPQTDYSLPHLLKSLIYFTDAETEPMPRMHQDASWETVKSTLIKQAKSFAF